jgi:HK97 family phage portal protein
MGIFDRILGKAVANPREPLPLPLGQSRDVYLTGYGSGQLVSMLRRVLPGSQRDWSTVAGDLGLNSIIASAMDWYIRNWPQATPQVLRRVDSQQTEPLEEHPILQLMAEPEPGMVGNLLWGWVIQDYKLFGNAYLRKQRIGGPGSAVVALQYIPQDMIRPVGNGRNPLTHYVYTTDGRSFELPVVDVIHFRYGRDPDDIRLGRSPMQSVLREVATDNMASSSAYGLLGNGAMPSIIVGPDASGSAQVDISPDDAKQVKRSLRENLTGDNAGGIVVMSGPYKMDRVSLTPAELALDALRRLPEERICSALGLNPMVLGLGSGLDRSTYSNYERAQQAAWEDGMVPLLRSISDTLTISLLPDFAESEEGDRVAYDLSGVRALADDRQAESDRAEKLYKAGICDRAEAKRMAGLQPTAEDEGVVHPTAASPSAPGGLDVGDAANAAGILIRSGYEPGAVSRLLGINIPHTGAAPVTLREEAKSFSWKSHPNEGMREAARRALRWKEEGRQGGTRVGLARANQIANDELISEDTILRMYSFFRRHEIDKEAEGFDQGEAEFPSPGRVAWDLWGGDAGYAWATRLRDKILRGEKLPGKSADDTCDHGSEVPYISHPFYDLEIETVDR